MRILNPSESKAFLDKEIARIGALNNYGANWSWWAAGIVGVKLLGNQNTGGIIGGQVAAFSHNLSNLSDELTAVENTIDKTKLGLIEITTITNTCVPSAIDGGGLNIVTSSSSEYYIPNGELVGTATSNGN